MLMSRQHRFIFVHIYKNAGISITSALMPYAATPAQIKVDNFLNRFGISYLYPLVIKDNSTVQEWISNILNNIFERSMIFKDHPQPVYNHASASEIISKLGKDVFNSYFSFGIVRNPWDWQVSMYQFGLEGTTNPRRGKFKGFGSFENYIRWRCQEDVHYQKDFLFSENGDQLVNFIGKYENLETDFRKICENVGIDARLPKLNQSARHKRFQDYYTPETMELVRRTFAPDIELFGYNFD